MPSGWFKPMSYGAGAVPATWQGWTVLGAYIVAVTVMAFVAFDGAREMGTATMLYLGAVAALTLGFVFFALAQAMRFKTEDNA